MSADLQNPIFNDEDAARKALEAVRWPDGPNCPHCGNADPYRLAKGRGKVARPGLWYCAECNGQFTATVGTVFERSKIPLSKWWLAMHLLGSSKKGISSHQLHRMLGVTYKTAWFMSHRIREAMVPVNPGPMGGPGKHVEADETYFGRQEGKAHAKGRGPSFKMMVLTLVERGGSARSVPVDSASIADLAPHLRQNIDRKSTLQTDEWVSYKTLGQEFAAHQSVTHSRKEYVRGEAHTNTVEGYYSIFKRGMKGIYQHCAEKHLHRYLTEFDFRYSNRVRLGVHDKERVNKIAAGIAGKRLMYRRTDEAHNKKAVG